MATYDSTAHPTAFAHMEGGAKTVYVVPATNEFSNMCSGDRLEFGDLGYITVGAIKRYDTLVELMETEGFANVVPEADTAEEAVRLIEGDSSWEQAAAKDKGILALRVRSVKRSA